jgi:hypothetical protein
MTLDVASLFAIVFIVTIILAIAVEKLRVQVGAFEVLVRGMQKGGSE